MICRGTAIWLVKFNFNTYSKGSVKIGRRAWKACWATYSKCHSCQLLHADHYTGCSDARTVLEDRWKNTSDLKLEFLVDSSKHGSIHYVVVTLRIHTRTYTYACMYIQRS